MSNKNKAILGGVCLGCKNESIDQGRSYYQNNINVSDCSFLRVSLYSGDGGIIYVSGSDYSMNVSYSMFYNCFCSIYGGSIYFYSSNSSIRMICANRCSASYRHFAWLVASQMNQIDHLSVSYCSPATSGYTSIELDSGNQRVDNTNSSMNNAFQVSGIAIDFSSSFTSSHCTFSNNNVSECVCIGFYSESGTISMSFANIVHNNSPSENGVVYVIGGSIEMNYCIFKDNENTLFCVESGSLEVSHCFISHIGMTPTGINNSLSKRETYQMQFFNSHYCNADIPLSLRTPIISIEETLIITLLMSCEQTKNNNNQNKSYSFLLYSTSLFMCICVFAISYYLIIRRNHHYEISSSSSKSNNFDKSISDLSVSEIILK